ncbi:hypothetical protein ARMGADRAFT_1015269 [Armillaria gallica]|uniref:Uncharacterized protein n=1 Tax=Armillaria gallica TaxID=47427 RepID=A0A2H3D6C9_ARMGA|nr:hypothetical protein ARMGADRAFT_1015269 [Armillaria gallica]
MTALKHSTYLNEHFGCLTMVLLQRVLSQLLEIAPFPIPFPFKQGPAATVVSLHQFTIEYIESMELHLPSRALNEF